MFKLLTEESRARVANEYKLRRIVVIVAALSVVAAVALVGLFPSYILSQIKQLEAQALSASREEDEGLTAWLSGFNQKLRVLSARQGAQTSSHIEKALALKTGGVRITQFKWDSGEGGIALSFIGVASDRQSLLAFEKRLKESGDFADVMLPVSNLAKERDINFQINLSIKP